MKSLIDYIREHRTDMEVVDNVNESLLLINFDGMDDTDDLLKTLSETDGVSVDDKSVEIADDLGVDKLEDIYNILKTYSDTQRSSSHRSSDENYAQKTLSIEKKVNDLRDSIDKIKNPDTEDKECKDCDKKNEEE